MEILLHTLSEFKTLNNFITRQPLKFPYFNE